MAATRAKQKYPTFEEKLKIQNEKIEMVRASIRYSASAFLY